VANPIKREALAADGKVIKDKAEELSAPAHKGFAQQLQAVARAERTGQIDPRLTGVFGDFDECGQFKLRAVLMAP